MKNKFILTNILSITLLTFIGCSNSSNQLNSNKDNLTLDHSKNIDTETIEKSVPKTFDNFTDDDILEKLNIDSSSKYKILNKNINNNSLSILILQDNDLSQYNFIIENNNLKLDNKVASSKYIEFKNNLSTEIPELLSNKGFNYSLICADVKTPDYFALNSYSKDIKDISSPSASVIKIYIMISAYYKISNGDLDSNSKVILQDSMKVGGSGILSSKESGTEYAIDYLIYLMITESDNTATNILIDLIGQDYINSTIKELGCTNTSLNRKMMDIAALNSGIDNYTSVYDLYITFMQLYNNCCINEFYDNKILNILKENKFNTKIPNQLPSNTIVAHKTGELTSIENDAGIIFTSNGDYILCILTENGSNNIESEAISSTSKKIYDLYTSYTSSEY